MFMRHSGRAQNVNREQVYLREDKRSEEVFVWVEKPSEVLQKNSFSVPRLLFADCAG